MSKSVREVLDKAIQLLEEGGWTTEDYDRVKSNGKVAYCSLGALRKAALDDIWTFASNPNLPTYRASVLALTEAIGLSNPSADSGLEMAVFGAESMITDWNDNGDRRKADVLEAFRKARDAQPI